MSSPTSPTGEVPAQVSDNLANIGQLIERERRKIGAHQRAVETITRWLARPGVFYLLIVLATGWIVYNELAPAHGWSRFDASPFSKLQGVVTLYAAAVATAVLIAQRRQREVDERRGALEFHLNLLSEQKATKIIALLEELRRDLPNVRNRADPVADLMQKEVDPKAMHSALHRDHGQ